MISALPDANLLNAAKELGLRAAQLSAFGCYTGISDDILNPNTIRIIPGAIIPVKRNAGPSGPSIAPLPGVGNVNAQLMLTQELQANIKRVLLDESLPPPAVGPNMTATEVLERVRKIQRDFGSVFGRISYELLQPILQRSIDILTEKGLLSMPSIFSKIDNFTIKMKIVSPIARMQSLQDVESITQVIQILGSISPELISALIKLEQLGEWLADKLGAPQKFLKSVQEQEEERMAMEQQQQAMAEQQQAMTQQQGEQQQAM